MKNNKPLIITLIVILAILTVFLITFFIGIMNSNFQIKNLFNYFDRESTELVIDETYENTIDKLSIDTDISNIYIKENKDNNIVVKIYGKKNDVKVDSDEDRLSINIKSKPCFGFCINQTLYRIEVYLPSNYNQKILIKNDYGDIDVAKFKEALIEVEADCGDIKVLGGNQVKLTNDYGDITLDEADYAEINQSCGNINIGEINKIIAKNDFGDIKVDKVNESVDLENDCGNIEVDELLITDNSQIICDLGDIKIGDTSDIYIDAKVDLGKIDINSNNKKSDITLKVENDCGNILVNN